ncbi:multisubunit sodium/proton antiporter, MrpC subunit [Kytococcus aerolatus]|uniref:Multisubunit sodium/proton antiporter, MrpC subunit n=1 Tax=Kytococcus aerolatus TaxID=592308 RepID=A0A212U5A1_9MICO|nr:Na(+)/H(+) antiporter subunit C [Kytococcus aerolatus]SNC73376.1 multisubunit sodium/proton antiporter, MrpC subunit [Kytococcus aerolatus]
MIPNLTLCLVAGVLSACGVYLFLSRSLVRVLFGMLLFGNGVNILFLVAGGPAGRPPISGENDPSTMADPLPQAMVLTAIVISLAMSAFVLALAHRSWQISRSDLVEADPENLRISRRSVDNDYPDEVFSEASTDTAHPEEEGR